MDTQSVLRSLLFLIKEDLLEVNMENIDDVGLAYTDLIIWRQIFRNMEAMGFEFAEDPEGNSYIEENQQALEDWLVQASISPAEVREKLHEHRNRLIDEVKAGRI